MAELFGETFEKCQNMEDKKSLIKMFKIWDLFFDAAVLEKISRKHELHEYVRY